MTYREEVLKRKGMFEDYMIKEIPLNEDEQLSLIYQHKGAVVLVTVYQKVDNHEIKSFLEHVYKYVQELSN